MCRRRGSRWGCVYLFDPRGGDIFSQGDIDALQGVHERFRLLVQHSAHVVWRSGALGEFIGAQESWERFTGHSCEAYRSLGGLNAIHPEDQAAVGLEWDRAIAGAAPFESEYRLRHRSGEYRHVHARGIPLLDSAGQVREWLGIIEDITERKRSQEALLAARDRVEELLAEARESERRLATELDASMRLHELSTRLIKGGDLRELYEPMLETAIALMHSDFASMQMLEVDATGSEALRLLAYRGFHPQSARHWDWVSIGSTTSCGVAFRNLERFIVRDVEQWQAIEGTADLEEFRRSGIRAIQSTPLLSRAGRLLGMVSTHWRGPYEPTEAELRTFDIFARQVADLIERRHGEDALREADRRKDEFIAMLAHELRNPLAPIRNAVEILKRVDPPHPQASWSRELIARQTEHMARLLDDLLDVSRISRNRLQLRKARITLESVLEAALETSRPAIEAGGHTLTVRLPSHPIDLEADLVRLAQVFSNLLNNAAKYTPDGGQISVVGEFDRAGAGCGEVVVSVKDTGIGIEPDLLPRLFQLFSQGEPILPRARGGLGIGLALTRRLVEMHGGTVSVRSAGPDRGSEFIVRLPASAGEPLPEPASRDADEPLAGQRLLVVDDNRECADSLATLLRLSGMEARTAYDGTQAIELAAALRPDVILLDVGLPEMSGHEVCRRIRELPQGADIVIVALTGWGQDDDRRRSSDAGFDGHLVKPVEFAALTTFLAQRARARQSAG